MEQQLSPIEKLDEVLKFFATDPFVKGGVTLTDLTKKLCPPITDGDELVKILDKLISDDFVKATVYSPPYYSGSGVNYFAITFIGAYQFSVGGYQQIENSATSENTRLDKLEKREIKRDKFLVMLTAIIAFGTLIAAAYYLIELLKYFHVLPSNW